MIISFYDNNFKGLQNNASLLIDKDSYSLVKRPVEMNTLTCVCEPFTEDIQPTFVIVKDDLGRKIYSSLAGVPMLTNDNKTEVNGTDLKSMLSSDVVLTPVQFDKVNIYIQYIFNEWNTQVNKGSLKTELVFVDYGTNGNSEIAGDIEIGDLKPSTEKAVYNAFEELQSYLKYYNLYIDSDIDLVNKKVVFTIGKTQRDDVNIKLWEYGIKDYGKWIADVNECQGYYDNGVTWTPSNNNWIMTSKGEITVTESKRDIYPIKRNVIVSTKSMLDADTQALSRLLDNLYQEDITLSADRVKPRFETNFKVYVNKGSEEPYKELPCGELVYDNSGMIKFQIGYRFVGAEFI